MPDHGDTITIAGAAAVIILHIESSEPLVEQVERGLRAAIASGAVEPGEELPPVRRLADDLGIHWNTVARAYRALEACGLVIMLRGRGTRVIADRESRAETPAAQARRLDGTLRAALSDARLAGLSRPEAEELIAAVMRDIWPAADRQ